MLDEAVALIDKRSHATPAIISRKVREERKEEVRGKDAENAKKKCSTESE